jgi:hypothetical protein
MDFKGRRRAEALGTLGTWYIFISMHYRYVFPQTIFRSCPIAAFQTT